MKILASTRCVFKLHGDSDVPHSILLDKYKMAQTSFR